MSLLAGWTMDMWSPIINLFNFIPSFGFMIIVFTIILKLILSPLDFWQRKVSRASTIKQAEMQPELAKIQKACGNNKQLLNQKTMQLYKKHNYNLAGSCVSMLLNMAITLFIFITLFSGLMDMSKDKIYKQYQDLSTVYNTNLTESLGGDNVWTIVNTFEEDAKNELISEGIADPTETQILQRAYQLFAEKDIYAEKVASAQAVAAARYEEIKESWLWIDNLWRPDTHVAGFANFNDFCNISSIKSQDLTVEQLNQITAEYDILTANIQKTYSSWNGYYILVILAAIITYLSIWVTQKMTPQRPQQKFTPVNNSVKQNNQMPDINPGKSMGIMKFIMPIIMVIFTFGYSAAFALYIVVNSIMATLIAVVCNLIFNKMDKNKPEKPKKVEYSR